MVKLVTLLDERHLKFFVHKKLDPHSYILITHELLETEVGWAYPWFIMDNRVMYLEVVSLSLDTSVLWLSKNCGSVLGVGRYFVTSLYHAYTLSVNAWPARCLTLTHGSKFEPWRARPQTARARISNNVSGGPCHLIHLLILSLAYICHKTPCISFLTPPSCQVFTNHETVSQFLGCGKSAW